MFLVLPRFGIIGEEELVLHSRKMGVVILINATDFETVLNSTSPIKIITEDDGAKNIYKFFFSQMIPHGLQFFGFTERRSGIHVRPEYSKEFGWQVPVLDGENLITFPTPTYAGTIMKLLFPEKFEPETLTFLDHFTQFLLVFDFEWQSDSSYQQLKRILKKTADTNWKRSAVDGYDEDAQLELLIAITPRGNVLNQAQLALAAIQETNSLFPGTVTKLILNCRSQRLGLETLPVVNSDIHITEALLNAHPSVSFGLILDGRNCFGSEKYFLKLELRSIDLIIIMTDTQIEETAQLAFVSSSPCISRVIKASRSSKQVKLPAYGNRLTDTNANLNFQNATFFFNRSSLLTSLAKYYAFSFLVKSIPIMEIKPSNHKYNDLMDPVMETNDTLEKWLRLDNQFNKQFTGRHQPPSSLENILLLVNEFRKYKWLYRNSISYCGKYQHNLMIAVNAYQDKTSSHFVSLNRAIVLATAAIANASQVDTNGISTILLNWKRCSDIKHCEGINTENLEGGQIHQDLLSILPFIEEAKQIFLGLKFQTNPKIGLMLDWQFCHKFYMMYTNIQANITSTQRLRNVDYLVFKTYVHKQEIVEHGALKASNSIIASLQVCSGFFDTFPVDFGAAEFSINSAYYVVIYGCNGSVSDIREYSELARFSELISQWALSVETKVFIGSAVEEAGKMTQNCTLYDAQYSKENCDCGWWQANPDDGKFVDRDHFVFQDKKSIALKLYEGAHQTPETKPTTNLNKYHELLLKILIPVSVLIAILLIAIITLLIRYRLKSGISSAEIQTFFKGRHDHLIESQAQSDAAYNNAQNQPYNRDKYELSRSMFKIDANTILGCGEFCTVHPATIKRGIVPENGAVKILKKIGKQRSHGDFLGFRGLISEIKILSYIGKHKNVIQLVGACTANIKLGKLMVFLELCENGSLFQVLRSSQTHLLQQLPYGLLQDLFIWSREIACGMEFLATRNIVHADLASRNVLVTADKVAKISDFGLSRRLYDDTEYIKHVAGPLPWRWMAPESLRKLIFNEKTDVWAFGITLWEIFTLGDEPYPGLSWEVNFPALLEGGLRLEEPRYNEMQMYSIMKRCLCTDPECRPLFKDICSILPDPSDNYLTNSSTLNG